MKRIFLSAACIATAMGIAHAKNVWQSNYLNMNYTPGSAVCMIIAGVASSSVTTYPNDMKIGYETRVGDLSSIETSKKFCTSSIPLNTLIRGTVNRYGFQVEAACLERAD